MAACVRIVEDDHDLEVLMRVIVDKAGGTVADAVPREQILTTTPWEGITHAIVDLRLMGWAFNGLDVLRFLTEIFPSIIRIACSISITDKYDALAMEAQGLAHFAVSKPVSPAVLQRLIST